MNINYKRIEQLCRILRTRADRKLFAVTKIESVPCGYKTNNTPPQDGWQSLSCMTEPEEHFWLRGQFSTPAARDGKRYLLRVETGTDGWNATNPQGLIYLNGYMTQGLDVNHKEVFIEPNTDYDLHIYFYTGDITRPILPDVYIIEQDIETENLYWDFYVPFETLPILNENTAEYKDTLSLLCQAADILDLRGSDKNYQVSVKACREFLDKEFYNGICSTEGKPIVHSVGHTHIDVEWKWHRAQTKEKTQRSFATVKALMDQYPEYTFMMSQPNLYEYIREEAPEKYDEIKELVKAGRWEPEGAMYLECDCNLSSGESFIRQILQGKRFFRKEFGVDCKILFLPDVFGYSAALPQILKKSGIDYFVTSKISWNDTNQMPVDSFVWEGIDGTEIYSTFMTTPSAIQDPSLPSYVTTYVGRMNAAGIFGTWDRYQQKEYNKHVLTTFGFGDGGGGPTKEMLEKQRRFAKGLPGMPVVKPDFLLPTLQAAEKDFYLSAEKLKKTPRWVGELYLEFHRGTYTSVAKIKKNNRKSEFMMQKAEALSMTDLLSGGKYDAKGLYDIWTKILHDQFHDILPGSSIGEVYDGTDKDYAEVFEYGNEVIDTKLQSIAQRVKTQGGILVSNSLGFARGGNITVDGQTMELTDKIPAFGWKVVNPVAENRVCVDGLKAENDAYIMELDETGAIISLFDKQAGRQIVKAGEKMNAFCAYADHPYSYDAWEISPYYANNPYPLEDKAEITPIVDSSRSGFKIVKSYMESTVTQYIWLNSHSRRIDFDNEIDWHQKHQLLKVLFPINVHTSKATYEIQCGHVERPTHKNTGWDAAKFEVCAHKWVDLSEKGYGVSLLNDCKYGYSAEGSTLTMTVLKCPDDPYPQADEGLHVFSYALLPHEGDLFDGGVIQEAYSFNQPLDAVTVGRQDGTLPQEFSLVSCDAPNVIVETVKKAEDSDDMIVRLYEAWNSQATVMLTVPDGFTGAKLVDLMEEEMEDVPLVDNRVTLKLHNFEIATLKFTR